MTRNIMINQFYPEVFEKDFDQKPIIIVIEFSHLSNFYSDARCAGSCEIMTLGTYNNKQNFQAEGKRVTIYTTLATSLPNLFH